MKALLGVAGLLGLIALAFGDQAASHAAKAILGVILLGVILLAFDILTGGVISQHL